ncbi:alpha/beta hydrolase [Flavihumibacter sp. RY-1]|uniref:Alpha/beta hydrolase n=1 Tax=Flavihumibacter fluminis TaxID=2909236 RepID=A0ABS9BEJ9_9BACT|nr:alpha/beta hydrolase [Flavihumibacter fluminis]
MNVYSVNNTHKRKNRFIKITGILLLLILAGFLSFNFSPWPSTLLIRYAFNKEAVKMNAALEKHVPPGIKEMKDIPYDPLDQSVMLDLYFPSNREVDSPRLPLVVWFHGGGLISGNKEQVGNYCKILAAKGFAVASVDYTIAPEANYPIPIRQANAALAYLSSRATDYSINNTKIFLAGDSGGSMIAAQLANLLSDKRYADSLGIQPSIDRSALAGMLLYCGIYDISNLNLSGSFGQFLRTVLWAYGGRKDFENHPSLHTASVFNYITNNFPPSFISAGNNDPLLLQSTSLARKLAVLQVPVDTVFYPANFQPALPHEYQFNLDIAPGQQVLDRAVLFMQQVVKQH